MSVTMVIGPDRGEGDKSICVEGVLIDGYSNVDEELILGMWSRRGKVNLFMSLRP